MIGVGIFAYYAFSPEQRNSNVVVALQEYVTIENATIAVLFGIASKLIFDVLTHFRHK